MPAVLFVCLGNICRSPAGEGVLRALLEKEKMDDLVDVASCGIGDWHVGQLADQRMRSAAGERGIVLASRAQAFTRAFLDDFDMILAADREVMHGLHRFAKSPEHKVKISLITSFSSAYKDEEVPDPYYGSKADFDLVLDMLEDSCQGIIKQLRQRFDLP